MYIARCTHTGTYQWQPLRSQLLRFFSSFLGRLQSPHTSEQEVPAALLIQLPVDASAPPSAGGRSLENAKSPAGPAYYASRLKTHAVDVRTFKRAPVRSSAFFSPPQNQLCVTRIFPPPPRFLPPTLAFVIGHVTEKSPPPFIGALARGSLPFWVTSECVKQTRGRGRTAREGTRGGLSASKCRVGAILSNGKKPI